MLRIHEMRPSECTTNFDHCDEEYHYITKSAGTDHANHCGFVFYHNSVHDQDCDMLMQAGLTVPLLTTANWPFRL